MEEEVEEGRGVRAPREKFGGKGRQGLRLTGERETEVFFFNVVFLYMYMCVYMCVCLCFCDLTSHTHTHPHQVRIKTALQCKRTNCTSVRLKARKPNAKGQAKKKEQRRGERRTESEKYTLIPH